MVAARPAAGSCTPACQLTAAAHAWLRHARRCVVVQPQTLSRRSGLPRVLEDYIHSSSQTELRYSQEIKGEYGEKIGASRWDAKPAPKCKGGRPMVCQEEKCTMHTTTLSLMPKSQFEVPLATSASRLSRPATRSSTRSAGDIDRRASFQPSALPSGTGPGLLPFSCRSS